MNALPTEVWTGRDERDGGALFAVKLILDAVHRVELVRNLARTTTEVVAGTGIFRGRDDLNRHAIRQRSVVLQLVSYQPIGRILQYRRASAFGFGNRLAMIVRRSSFWFSPVYVAIYSRLGVAL